METDGDSYWPFAVVTLYELVRDDLLASEITQIR